MVTLHTTSLTTMINKANNRASRSSQNQKANPVITMTGELTQFEQISVSERNGTRKQNYGLNTWSNRMETRTNERPKQSGQYFIDMNRFRDFVSTIFLDKYARQHIYADLFGT